jgi:hypothetical protein
MDIGKSFTYVLDDEEWLTKILIGGFFSLLSGLFIGIPFLLGYFLETLKNVYQGQPRPLPDWGENLGAIFSKGLKAVVGVLVWSLPIIAVTCISAVVMTGMINNLQKGQETPLVILYSCVTCLAVAYGLVMSALMPAALMKFAVTGELNAFFRVGDMIGFIRNNLGNYLIAIIVYWLAEMLGSFGFILCLVGLFFTAFWSMLVGAHLFGQVYRAAQGQPA